MKLLNELLKINESLSPEQKASLKKNQDLVKKINGGKLESEKFTKIFQNNGAKDAARDYKEGYVTKDDIKDEKALRKHLEVSIGALKKYQDDYINKLKEIFARADKKYNSDITE